MRSEACSCHQPPGPVTAGWRFQVPAVLVRWSFSPGTVLSLGKELSATATGTSPSLGFS
jgi:hypothetical protein